MRTNADITLYIQYRDGSDDKYIRVPIKGVTWAERRGAIPSGNGLAESKEVRIRVPVGADIGGRSYVDESSYFAKNGSIAANPETTWTLSSNAYVVKGISAADKPQEPKFKVMDYADNRDSRVSAYLQHWRVTAK